MKVLTYVIAFFLFSFLGWIFENRPWTCLGKAEPCLREKSYDNLSKRLGLNYVPFLWIYGFGAVLLLLLYNYLPGPLLFKIVIAVIVVNVMECIGGKVSYGLYGRQTWCYSRDMFPMCGGYISLVTALFWALLIAVFYLLLDGFAKPL